MHCRSRDSEIETSGFTGLRIKHNRGTKLMSEEVVVLKIFNNEIEAGMAQQVLQEAGMKAFVFKDDAGGMEPQLQRTTGVRLVVNRADAERAHQMLRI
jgi:hypothetical protein